MNLGWRGDGSDEDGRLPNQSMRVVVEFVGDAAPAAPTIDHEPRSEERSREALRKQGAVGWLIALRHYAHALAHR